MSFGQLVNSITILISWINLHERPKLLLKEEGKILVDLQVCKIIFSLFYLEGRLNKSYAFWCYSKLLKEMPRWLQAKVGLSFIFLAMVNVILWDYRFPWDRYQILSYILCLLAMAQFHWLEWLQKKQKTKKLVYLCYSSFVAFSSLVNYCECNHLGISYSLVNTKVEMDIKNIDFMSAHT